MGEITIRQAHVTEVLVCNTRKNTSLPAQTVDALLVGIEATGSMQWFLNLMDELQVLLRVSD